MQYEWTVKATDANVSLLQFIQKKLPDYSMRKIKGWIDAGYCFVASRQQRFARTGVLAGQKITLNVVEQKIEEIAYIYEDEAILVIDKPAGITCDERLVKSLAKANKQVILVHRLDKETTGLLLLAKSEDIKKYFIEEFRNLAVEKSYVAIVDGVIEKPSGHIENYLGPIERYQGHVKWGVVSRDGHLATTTWKVLKRFKTATELMLHPKTGKTHQLRIHTSFMGHPILGDHTYAKKFRCAYRAPRVLLHAKTLRFIHPTTKLELVLSAKLPKDFEACLDALSHH